MLCVGSDPSLSPVSDPCLRVLSPSTVESGSGGFPILLDQSSRVFGVDRDHRSVNWRGGPGPPRPENGGSVVGPVLTPRVVYKDVEVGQVVARPRPGRSVIVRREGHGPSPPLTSPH